MMETILSVNAAERLDSRGNPTVQVSIKTEKGSSPKSLMKTLC